MYWTGIPPHTLPVRDVLAFSEYAEELVEEHQKMLKSAVAQGVGEVMDEIL
jgi:hypothetical protein